MRSLWSFQRLRCCLLHCSGIIYQIFPFHQMLFFKCLLLLLLELFSFDAMDFPSAKLTRSRKWSTCSAGCHKLKSNTVMQRMKLDCCVLSMRISFLHVLRKKQHYSSNMHLKRRKINRSMYVLFLIPRPNFKTFHFQIV